MNNINGINGLQTMSQQCQPKADDSKPGGNVPQDKVEMGKPGPDIICYMPAPATKPEGSKEVEQKRQEALDKAVDDGTVSQDTADKLKPQRPDKITCYMVGPMNPPENKEGVEQKQQEAISKVLSEGIISDQTASKLRG